MAGASCLHLPHFCVDLRYRQALVPCRMIVSFPGLFLQSQLTASACKLSEAHGAWSENVTSETRGELPRKPDRDCWKRRDAGSEADRRKDFHPSPRTIASALVLDLVHGAGDWNRTSDLRFTKPLLCQLSYAGLARPRNENRNAILLRQGKTCQCSRRFVRGVRLISACSTAALVSARILHCLVDTVVPVNCGTDFSPPR